MSRSFVRLPTDIARNSKREKTIVWKSPASTGICHPEVEAIECLVSPGVVSEQGTSSPNDSSSASRGAVSFVPSSIAALCNTEYQTFFEQHRKTEDMFEVAKENEHLLEEWEGTEEPLGNERGGAKPMIVGSLEPGYFGTRRVWSRIFLWTSGLLALSFANFSLAYYVLYRHGTFTQCHGGSSTTSLAYCEFLSRRSYPVRCLYFHE